MIVTPRTTKVNLSFDLLSLGNTDEIAMAADAPHIAIAPPINIPNLYWKPNKRKSIIENNIVKITPAIITNIT